MSIKKFFEIFTEIIFKIAVNSHFYSLHHVSYCFASETVFEIYKLTLITKLSQDIPLISRDISLSAIANHTNDRWNIRYLESRRFDCNQFEKD